MGNAIKWSIEGGEYDGQGGTELGNDWVRRVAGQLGLDGGGSRTAEELEALIASSGGRLAWGPAHVEVSGQP